MNLLILDTAVKELELKALSYDNYPKLLRKPIKLHDTVVLRCCANWDVHPTPSFYWYKWSGSSYLNLTKYAGQWKKPVEGDRELRYDIESQGICSLLDFNFDKKGLERFACSAFNSPVSELVTKTISLSVECKLAFFKIIIDIFIFNKIVLNSISMQISQTFKSI